MIRRLKESNHQRRKTNYEKQFKKVDENMKGKRKMKSGGY